MAIKKFKPITNGTRNMSTLVNEEITSSTPEKSLLRKTKSNAGRNNQGKITVRHRGGGVKRKYRVIDFKRNKDGVIGTVTSIEYDPNRSANIALITYADGEKRYIIAPLNLKVGDKIESGENVDIKVGNALPLMNIPVGTVVHNVELNPGKGGQLARGAGSSAQILGREGKYVLLRLKSGETRKVMGVCRATIGTVGNLDYELVHLGKAGRKRHMGWRPTVRGSVMNPNDHPHGGGEGKAPVGRKGKYVLLRLKSGETRKVMGVCRATIGTVGNLDYELVHLGKAGRKRHMGWRPTVRGSVMNPNDHPHGGGEGKAPVGRKGPMTPWGKPALGLKTRKTKKASEKLIVSRRNK